MKLPSSDEDPAVQMAEEAVQFALKAVHDANLNYITACTLLGKAKIEAARKQPHPWLGLNVYRIMGGEGLRNRIEHGTVCFKDIQTPDYGNPHIAPGSYYVLVDGKSAHLLNKDWELDLL